jgi:exopolysaccharide biosynthesis polyprenyl glycosylphosphotransferase
MGLYDRDEERPEHTTIDDLVGVFQLVTIGIWLNFVVASVTGLADPELGKWIRFWAIAIAFVALARSGARFLARRSPQYVQNALVVGTDRTAQIIARKLLQHPEYRIDVVGFVDASPKALQEDVSSLPVVGAAADLMGLVQRLDIDRVVFAFSGLTDREMMQLARRLPGLGVQADIVPRFFEALGPNTKLTPLEGVQLVSLPPVRLSRAALIVKRVFDTVVAGLMLLFLWPVFLAVALWIRRDSPGPVFFVQTRLGLNQRPFAAYKFRTMRADTSPDVHREYIKSLMDSGTKAEAGGVYKLDRGDAVTRAGRWLRKTSLDELPQLFNVLRGDMSLVGPRPCIPYETEHFEPHHFERFSVPAGITGLWQVKARARSPFVEALEMDVLYARSWSFGFDVMLLLQTPVQVFRPRATR